MGFWAIIPEGALEEIQNYTEEQAEKIRLLLSETATKVGEMTGGISLDWPALYINGDLSFYLNSDGTWFPSAQY